MARKPSRGLRTQPSEFIAAAWSLVGCKVNKRAKLEELYELAQSSIALPVAVDSPAIDTFRLQPGKPTAT